MGDWRQDGRWDALRTLARHTRRVKWSSALLGALVDELHIGEEFVRLVGDPRRLPVARYPHAIVIALALRHSWRPDDFQRIHKRLFPHAPRAQHRATRPHATAADRRHRR